MKHESSMRTRILWAVLISSANVWTLHGVTLPPILIGVSNVQSGPSRSLGQQLMQGSMSYFTLINDRGGIRGRKITVVLKDDKYEPDPGIGYKLKFSHTEHQGLHQVWLTKTVRAAWVPEPAPGATR